MSEIILEAEEVHTHIGQHHILQGVSFTAPADSVTVLIGRNGAGKSTTLKTLMGLLPASSGRIVPGIASPSKRHVMCCVSLVFSIHVYLDGEPTMPVDPAIVKRMPHHKHLGYKNKTVCAAPSRADFD